MRTALVTGPSSGIGRVVATQLAQHGFHVVAAGRSAQRVGAVVNQIRSAGGSAEFLELDLASLNSARLAGRTFANSGHTIDVLVNNAGVGFGRSTTSDGFEIHFGINHLGHFMLTEHLGPSFHNDTRIIQVSSHVHYRATDIDFDRVTRRTRSWFGAPEYAVSKLANILFIRELARRHPDRTALAAHPGLVDTGIFPAPVKPFIRRKLLTPEEGADTIVWLATTDEPLESGGYYARRAVCEPSPAALNDKLARELWSRSEQWCGTGPYSDRGVAGG